MKKKAGKRFDPSKEFEFEFSEINIFSRAAPT